MAAAVSMMNCAVADDSVVEQAEAQDVESQHDDYIDGVAASDDPGKADAFGDFTAEYSLSEGITPLRQLDYPNTRLFDGRGCSRSISRSGCAVAAHAMLMDYYGRASTLPEHNTRLGNSRGNSGCLLKWDRGLAEGLSYAGFGSGRLSTIKSELDDGAPVIAHVARPGRTRCHHFVLVTGYSRDGSSRADYEILDPTTGSSRNLSAYSRVCSTRLFDGPQPEAE